MSDWLRDKIFTVKDLPDFHKLTLQVFDFQYSNNTVYQDFTNRLKKGTGTFNQLTDFPFLPVEFSETTR